MQVQFPPLRRPRRLRRHPAIRALVQEARVCPSDLIQPLFVKEGEGRESIAGLPGQFRYGVDALVQQAERLRALGIPALALFPCVGAEKKDPEGAEALNEDNLILRAIRALKSDSHANCIFADVALDPYTSHGHDGLLSAAGDEVDNDATVRRLAEMAVLQAAAGADFVAPSDMMDARVLAIRQALDLAGHTQTGILAYTAKFASAYYQPFRTAIGSAQQMPLDKRSYQADAASPRAAAMEAELDAAEGADMLLVKPAGLYLDIVSQLRLTTHLPLAAWQVSGEYAQMHAAAQNGWLELEAACDESLLAIKRAGADCILTYFAESFSQRFS